MRLHLLALATLGLTGCMCRPGVVDCTTGRAYPGFCKPLCGGPCDPFMWLAGDCSNCCCCSYKCGYTPYGGRTVCGDEMVYGPSCISPPLQWAAPAVPSAPSGHVVHLPPPPLPPAPAAETRTGKENTEVPPVPAAPAAEKPPTPAVDPEVYEPPIRDSEIDEAGPPRSLQDARRDSPMRSRL